MNAPLSTDLVPAWAAQPLLERLKTCRVMLYQHGMLTESERAKVDQRIDRLESRLANERVDAEEALRRG